ncbi:Protein RETICULATA-related 1, chloroplastic [Vitis vinifera]|uniref:Protein RETICULATA-related 1, chloroplastic n=1 Tax=Vitis vinifera TaxID=29760 RepID=A0A438F2T9_VITVI|nr:Protein RETICULATA-related 1, chloroplastic [Vitis vinifera]
MWEAAKTTGIREVILFDTWICRYHRPFALGSVWPLGFGMKHFSMLRNRMLADPSFLFKVGTEAMGCDKYAENATKSWVVIDSCCATFAEVQKRGKDFWAEFELYAADLLVGVVVDIALVGMLAPYTRFGQPSISRGLVGRIQHACAALPSSVFEAERPGCRFSVKQRIATYFYKGVLYGSVGFGCGLIGQGIANAIMTAKRSKGLRQGDPISPYLFILGMEVLSALIRRAVQGNFITGCRLRGRGGVEMNVSHLLFADDTIIFCEDRKDHLTHLGWILAWFEAASGLRINLAKSCKVGSLPVKYLGLPLGARHKALSTWDGVEERMRRRLALWKRQYLSKGGRITLIKSTLASIPIYQMSIFRMPKSVVKRLEKLQRDFLWGGEARDVLWKKVIGVKHGLEGCGWRSKEVHGPFGVGVWKEILKETSWCWDNMKFKIFALAVCSNELVNEVWDPRLGQGRWNLRLSRDSNDWELVLIEDLLFLLRDIWLTPEEDSVLWKGGDFDIFQIRVAYNLLAAPNPLVFPGKNIWVDKVPTKVAFFAWEATWEKILTLDRALWEIAFALFGVQWVFPEKVKEALFCWRDPFVVYGVGLRCIGERSPLHF